MHCNWQENLHLRICKIWRPSITPFTIIVKLEYNIKMILTKQCGGGGGGLHTARDRAGGDSCECSNEISGSVIGGEILDLLELLLGSQDGVCFIELINLF
jgi:hypothetical protein